MFKYLKLFWLYDLIKTQSGSSSGAPALPCDRQSVLFSSGHLNEITNLSGYQ